MLSTHYMYLCQESKFLEYNLFLSLTELSVVIFKLIIFATSDYNYKAINIVLCLLGTAAASLVVVRFYSMIMRRSCL